MLLARPMWRGCLVFVSSFRPLPLFLLLVSAGFDSTRHFFLKHQLPPLKKDLITTQPPSSAFHQVAMTMAHLSTPQQWEADTLALFATRDRHEKAFTNMVESCKFLLVA